MFKSILVVCIGNICRSPVAEVLFKHYSAMYNLGLKINSAGVHALDGAPAQAYSQEVAKENKLDLSHHIAKQLTPELIYQHELILVMDEPTRTEAIGLFPFATGKIKKLGHYSNTEIVDPYLQPKEAFVEVFQTIQKCTDEWMKNVWNIAPE